MIGGGKNKARKKINWHSILVIFLYLLLVFYIGRLNLFVSEAYRLAHAEVPDDISRYIRFAISDYFIAWVLLSVFLIAKDLFISHTKAIIVNGLFFIFCSAIFLCYPMAVDTIHLPLSKELMSKNLESQPWRR